MNAHINTSFKSEDVTFQLSQAKSCGVDIAARLLVDSVNCNSYLL